MTFNTNTPPASNDQKPTTREQNRLRAKERRGNETRSERRRRLDIERARSARRRQNETEGERERRRHISKTRGMLRRQAETKDEQDRRRAINRARMATKRMANKQTELNTPCQPAHTECEDEALISIMKDHQTMRPIRPRSANTEPLDARNFYGNREPLPMTFDPGYTYAAAGNDAFMAPQHISTLAPAVFPLPASNVMPAHILQRPILRPPLGMMPVLDVRLVTQEPALESSASTAGCVAQSYASQYPALSQTPTLLSSSMCTVPYAIYQPILPKSNPMSPTSTEYYRSAHMFQNVDASHISSHISRKRQQPPNTVMTQQTPSLHHPRYLS
ncbi:hypothetical protein IWW35_003743 [Coemansia sp. RSA 1878]|nr:hypothetical protein IWW35_003743 [Coemansia sp. RSA 1878]